MKPSKEVHSLMGCSEDGDTELIAHVGNYTRMYTPKCLRTRIFNNDTVRSYGIQACLYTADPHTFRFSHYAFYFTRLKISIRTYYCRCFAAPAAFIAGGAAAEIGKTNLRSV
jgi:hypothetical protein